MKPYWQSADGAITVYHERFENVLSAGLARPAGAPPEVREAPDRAKLKRGDLVFVPHGGSGPDLPACRAMGLRLIWCDVEQWCCDTAIARLPEAPIEIVQRAKAFQRTTRIAPQTEHAGPLFGGAR